MKYKARFCDKEDNVHTREFHSLEALSRYMERQFRLHGAKTLLVEQVE